MGKHRRSTEVQVLAVVYSDDVTKYQWSTIARLSSISWLYCKEQVAELLYVIHMRIIMNCL